MHLITTFEFFNELAIIVELHVWRIVPLTAKTNFMDDNMHTVQVVAFTTAVSGPPLLLMGPHGGTSLMLGAKS